MAKLLSFVLLFICANHLFAQAGGDEYTAHAKQIIASVFDGPDKPLVVAEKLDSFTLETIKDALSTDTFFHRYSYDNWKTSKTDTFALSEAERRFVDSSLEDMYNFKWTDVLLPGSNLLSQQGVDDMMAAGTGMPQYLKTHFKADKFYWLSKPLFLRNYTCCFFYTESNNGKSGGSQPNLCIYVLVNKAWQKLMKIKTG